MRPFIDHVLALLPFEPDAHRRLGGPTCTYVGHPLIERLSELRPGPKEALAREAWPPTLLVLPGTRRSEIERLMPVFGETLALLTQRLGPIDAVLPAVSRHRALIERLAIAWDAPVRIVHGEAAKYAAFRRARAALAASGTVTLELALAGVPMVVAYKVSRMEEAVARRLIKVPTIVLPNLILGQNAMPEFIQADCNAATASPTPWRRCIAGRPGARAQVLALDRHRRPDAAARWRRRRAAARRGSCCRDELRPVPRGERAERVGSMAASRGGAYARDHGAVMIGARERSKGRPDDSDHADPGSDRCASPWVR